MNIVNFHAHIYPQKIADKAVKAVGDFYTLPMNGDGTVEGLIAQGKPFGVTHHIVHSVATTPLQVNSINKFISNECKAYSQLVGFGSLHQDLENPQDSIAEILNLGLKGVKIHPDTQKFNADSTKMFEIYDMLRGKLPILIHCGDYRFDYSHPRRIKNIVKNFPDLTVIAAHFGGWSLWDMAMEYLMDSKCYMDTSSSFAFLGTKRSREIVKAYGAERLLFGTDFPMWDIESELKRFDELKLSKNEQELILYKNAYNLLGIGK